MLVADIQRPINIKLSLVMIAKILDLVAKRQVNETNFVILFVPNSTGLR